MLGENKTMYFNYHARAKKLISDGKLIGFYFTDRYKKITPALVLIFDDLTHPIMPIRHYRFCEYLPLLPPDKEIKPP